MRKRRRTRKNPSRLVIALIGGGVALAIGAIAFFSGEKTAAASGGALPPGGGSGGGGGGSRLTARVTTNDPAPQGDLMIRSAPNGPGTPGIGAEKNGTVAVIRRDVLGDGQWSEVDWGGGLRLGPARGFVRTKFLTF